MAREAVVRIQLDGTSGPVLLERRIPELAAGGELSFHTSLPGDRADGQRRIVAFAGQPQGFAAFGPKYRSACFALTRAEGFTSWDSGTHRGQMGLGCPGPTERRAFVWGPGTENADFAEKTWHAYAETVEK